ncbi:hypothetical protein [Mycolicibacterium aichiense]|uniref:Uncharacterized protein n=1 Tax=Mycolicibacterium aichiense TaxID=1799 RepID=A0AAD1HPT6_9MYCO|nr:hypothetical protein [Mycolicibacterium aichiense]MCV7016755.1 hypothetical protein [Mycolicibacterium aichiense]QFG08035.1 hypothetical protein SEA_HERBERTWM_68 [Mycobacterium phage Herbertwm]BBX09462.1 hypothetical protein MAIC_42650 [Mycolicibacterium aichiense]SUA14027.1 Uncharacterised protein [Mycolicibacterium aichiense]
MRDIQPGMNVEKQRRKLTVLHDEAPPWHRAYIRTLIDAFDTEVAAGRPTPARAFIPMYHEEFGL